MSRVMQMPPPPPLLLTKRVTAFLRANLSEHIHSAMLTTPSGSLLAHASNLPATALRRQAAVAASLWDLQSPTPPPPPPQNPADPAPGPSNALPPDAAVRSRKTMRRGQPTVTVQLDTGAVFVIRRLRCGMLFICMGGSEVPSSGADASTPSHLSRPKDTSATTASSSATVPANPATADQPAPTDPSSSSSTNPRTRPSTPPSQHHHHHFHQNHQNQQQIPTITTSDPSAPPPSSSTSTTAVPTTPTHPSHSSHQTQSQNNQPHNSPSQASILSTNTLGAASTASTSGVSLMRRQVEELARWLDERLGGLCVPEEGIGVVRVGYAGAGAGAVGQQQQGYVGA
ncbi:hypothetical protein VTJ49DRAFT_3763 [Mycothermus thermophilus]|uniref:Roadblock/LAMTOR2 domain-containing protein n=1 Tax=Humicola insolens TaxID=85995 RepID=A0ABR3V6S3_HUMIN